MFSASVPRSLPDAIARSLVVRLTVSKEQKRNSPGSKKRPAKTAHDGLSVMALILYIIIFSIYLYQGVCSQLNSNLYLG